MKVRTLFLSDIHLGFHGCQSKQLLTLLKELRTEKIVLLGDIIDFWALKGSWYWPKQHTEVIEVLLKKARKGVEIVYVPGNHDSDLRRICGHSFKNIHFVEEYVHTCADGTRMLCVHGDKFDAVLQHNMWLAKLGSWFYDVLLSASTYVSRARELAGRTHWSLSKYLKHKVKTGL